MKNTTNLLLLLLCATIGVTSCKKDNSGPGGAIETALVKDMVITYANSTPTYHVDYDAQKRDNSWAYGDLTIERSFGSPQATSTMILDTKGRVSQVDTKGLNGFGNYYKMYYTYDEQGRVKTLKRRYRTENTDFADEGTEEFIYDGNNLSKIKHAYQQSNNYTITTFSGFSADYKNSLKTKNFGFDFFGTASYPSFFMDNGGSGHTGVSFYMFAGDEMPGKYTTREYKKSDDSPVSDEKTIYTYAYQKDSKGRIIQIAATYADGQKETLNISYY